MQYLIQPQGFSKHIDYKRPENYQPEWEHLFQPNYAYKKVKLGARILKNVFVNHYGLVIKNGFLVKGCAPNIGHFKYKDQNFYYQHWRKASEQWLVSKYGKSISAKRLDDSRTYLVIHSPWFSYYFWITECIPRLLMVKEKLKDLVLIYPESWKELSFVNETLELFPQLQIEVIPKDVHLFIKNLVMPEVKPWTPIIIPDHIDAIRSLFLKNIEIKKNRKIYISRDDAKYKRVHNNKEVNDLLLSKGYEIHTMGGKSLSEQINLMQQTQSLISINGAGLTNFIFLNEGAKILELSYKFYLTNSRYKFHFKKIANYLKCRYYVQFSDVYEDKNIEEVGLQNIIVDIKTLENNLNLMDQTKNEE